MNFDEALSYLLSLGHETLTIKLGLTNTKILLKALGNPHREFPAVQIAGTNGKGSVAVMLDSICRAAEIRAGLFTSPHLVSITERIRINGRQISELDFAQLTAQVKATADESVKTGSLERLPTFFEHVTAIALLAFREAKVELAILETGLGGRLDSTTAAGAQIVAITPVAMDHEEYLGNTLADIAAEKAAIIRPGVTAIIAPQSAEALAVILRQCESSAAKARSVGEQHIVDSSKDGRFRVNFDSIDQPYNGVRLGLRGRHQITNAASAIAVAEGLREHGFAIPHEAIVTGIENASHPGRLELRQGKPRILFDGAHNPAAARMLRDYLDEFVKRPITMIFGAMRDKQLDEIAAVLFPVASRLVLTEFDNPRAATAEMLTRIVPEGLDRTQVHHASSAHEALRIAKELTAPDDLICVTGSLYLVGAVRPVVDNEQRTVADQLA